MSLKPVVALLVLIQWVHSQSPQCKARGAASSGLSDRGRGKEKTRPSVAVLQHFSSTRVLQFNKCYVGNTIHRRLHCVIHSPVHIPKAVRATRPITALIADGNIMQLGFYGTPITHYAQPLTMQISSNWEFMALESHIMHNHLQISCNWEFMALQSHIMHNHLQCKYQVTGNLWHSNHTCITTYNANIMQLGFYGTPITHYA